MSSVFSRVTCSIKMVHASYKLYYFDFDGGAGEPVRNAFRIAKIPFEDCRVKSADWPQLKSSGKCIYGQMPILEIDGETYAQSMAILRYAGKVAGLYPTDPIEALKVDEMLDCCIDVRSKISPTYALPEAERIAARQKIVENFIRPHIANMEARVGENGFAVGDKLTIADLAVANEVCGLRSGRLDGVDCNLADDAPKLMKIVESVKNALAK
jgi:glutathione S-transferase